MEFGPKFLIYFLFIFVFCAGKTSYSTHDCNFPAIYNFGDSNSDTGGTYYVLPNGMTIGKSFKRGSDGLLIIDFLAESLGLPFLNGSMDLNGTSFEYGANFAVSGQRINPDPDPHIPHNWDHHLDEQVSRFFAFKSCANASKDSFSEALYTIDIGQNDINTKFEWKPVSTILDYFTNSVKRLLDDGAKYFWIHNTGPFGCMPRIATGCYDTNCTLDSIGCRVEFNAMAQDFNSELEKRVYMLRKEYPKAVITLVDMYAVKYNLISKNKDFDKELKFKYCCGNGNVFCANTGSVHNKTVFGGACRDPSKYISWDGVHYTQAANKIIAKQIINGDFSESGVKLSHACCNEGKG